MVIHNPKALAAELRLRALAVQPEERDELLFLAAEYELMAEASTLEMPQLWPGVSLPR